MNPSCHVSTLSFQQQDHSMVIAWFNDVLAWKVVQIIKMYHLNPCYCNLLFALLRPHWGIVSLEYDCLISCIYHGNFHSALHASYVAICCIQRPWLSYVPVMSSLNNSNLTSKAPMKANSCPRRHEVCCCYTIECILEHDGRLLTPGKNYAMIG